MQKSQDYAENTEAFRKRKGIQKTQGHIENTGICRNHRSYAENVVMCRKHKAMQKTQGYAENTEG